MTQRCIITDWNKTLVDSTEEDSNKSIGYAMLADAKYSVTHGDLTQIGTLGKLLFAKFLTKRKLAAYHDRKVPLADVYDAFNIALRGEYGSYVQSLAERHAGEIYRKVDERVLRPIRNVHNEGNHTAILSVGNERVINTALNRAGYKDTFNRILANTLEVAWPSGKAIGLSLDYYGKKRETVRRVFLSEFNPTHTFYIGDDPQDDGPIAFDLPSGHFIVPFLASEADRQKLLRGFDAFMPENEADLEKYLRTK